MLCCSSVGCDENHRIILFLGVWGGQFLWVLRWLMRPICAMKTLLQWGQEMVAGARGCRAFSLVCFNTMLNCINAKYSVVLCSH